MSLPLRASTLSAQGKEPIFGLRGCERSGQAQAQGRGWCGHRSSPGSVSEQVAWSRIGGSGRALFVTFELSPEPIQAPRTTCPMSKESFYFPPPKGLLAKQPSLGTCLFTKTSQPSPGELQWLACPCGCRISRCWELARQVPFPHS